MSEDGLARSDHPDNYAAKSPALGCETARHHDLDLMVRELMDSRMFPLTVNGIDDMTRELSR